MYNDASKCFTSNILWIFTPINLRCILNLECAILKTGICPNFRICHTKRIFYALHILLFRDSLGKIYFIS